MSSYFNEKETHNIKKYFDKSDYLKALSLIYEYIEKYPEDVFIQFDYAEIMLRLGKFKEAEKIINSIDLNTIKKDEIKQNQRKEYLDLYHLKLDMINENYKEAYEILEKRKEAFTRRGYKFQADIIYILRKLGIDPVIDKNIKINTYLTRQAYQYSEEAFYEHIQKHLYDQTEDNNDGVIFCKDFPYKEVCKELKEKLKDINCECDSISIVKYNIKYDNCGFVNGKLVNTFKIILFINSTNFITMYPYDNPHIEPHIDITPPIELYKSKQKRLSQIEKFNLKYNKNID